MFCDLVKDTSGASHPCKEAAGVETDDLHVPVQDDVCLAIEFPFLDPLWVLVTREEVLYDVAAMPGREVRRATGTMLAGLTILSIRSGNTPSRRYGG